jgi:two-component system, NtrC family, response regulator HydG
MQYTRKRILCVDDDEDTCVMMKLLLTGWNYEVVLATTAEEGLRLAESTHFDMYLLDTRLPESSGFELCEQLCAIPRHAPVVFISAAAYETDKRRGLQAGAIAYLTKPLDFDTLEITLAGLFPKTVVKEQSRYQNKSRFVSAQACLALC